MATRKHHMCIRSEERFTHSFHFPTPQKEKKGGENWVWRLCGGGQRGGGARNNNQRTNNLLELMRMNALNLLLLLLLGGNACNLCCQTVQVALAGLCDHTATEHRQRDGASMNKMSWYCGDSWIAGWLVAWVENSLNNTGNRA